MKKLIVLALVAAFVGFAWQSLPNLDQAQTPGAAQTPVRGSGVVLGVDQQRAVVTIRHGPLPALNMMAMTMSYPVKDRNQISGLKVNQKVEFQIVHNDGDFLITEIK